MGANSYKLNFTQIKTGIAPYGAMESAALHIVLRRFGGGLSSLRYATLTKDRRKVWASPTDF